MQQKNQNLNLYDWYLSEIFEVYYISHGKGFKKQKRIIPNPNLSQLWNFYLLKKDFVHLQKMIDSCLDDNLINTKDESDDTIVHKIKTQEHCLFALQNHANFSIINVDEETGYYYTSYYFIPNTVFQLAWKKLSKKEALKELKRPIRDSNTFANLCSSDKNFKKLIWLEKHFSFCFENHFKIQQYIHIAEKNNAYHNILFLKKMFQLKKNLQKNLPIPISSKSQTHKI